MRPCPDGDSFAGVVGPLSRDLRWRLRIACVEAHGPLTGTVLALASAGALTAGWIAADLPVSLLSAGAWRGLG